MARPVTLDPYQNFRFGLRLSKADDWIGFCSIVIVPSGPGVGAGTLELEKAWSEEFLSILKLGKTDLNIGVWHLTEEIQSKDPAFQIDIRGADFSRARLGQIGLDAVGQQRRERRGLEQPIEDPWTTVMIGRITVDYERMDVSIKDTSFKGLKVGAVSVRGAGPVFM